MKLKTASIIAASVGAVILFFSVVLPMLTLMNSDQGSIGIIGGADGPTAQFITFRFLIAPHMMKICFGATLLIAGLFCLVFSKTVKESCSIKTTALSLGISAAGGAGLYCLMIWVIIAGFAGISRHPITYPASIICGLISFALFIMLIVFYIKQRKAYKSVKGVIIDVLTSILFLPAFFCGFEWLYRLLA